MSKDPAHAGSWESEGLAVSSAIVVSDADPAHVLVRISGILDLLTADLLDDVLGAATLCSRWIHCDMGGVSFVDVRGLRPVLIARSRTERVGGGLWIRPRSRMVDLLLTQLGLSDLICGDLRSAAVGIDG